MLSIGSHDELSRAISVGSGRAHAPEKADVVGSSANHNGYPGARVLTVALAIISNNAIFSAAYAVISIFH